MRGKKQSLLLARVWSACHSCGLDSILVLSADVMTEGLVFVLTHRGHREGFSEVSVIVMTLVLLLRSAPGQLWSRPAPSRRALLVSFSIFSRSVPPFTGRASPPGPEAEPCSWLHIQALCSNPEFTHVALPMALNLLYSFCCPERHPNFCWGMFFGFIEFHSR